MSLKLMSTLLLGLALPLAACSKQTNTASRTPDEALHNGTPDGDHTDADPSTPPRDVDEVETENEGPEVPGPGYSGTRQDPPTPPTGAAQGPNGASPGGSAGPGPSAPAGGSAGPGSGR